MLKKSMCLILAIFFLVAFAACNKVEEEWKEPKSLKKVEKLLSQMENEGLLEVTEISESSKNSYVNYTLDNLNADYTLSGSVSKMMYVRGEIDEDTSSSEECFIIVCDNMLDADAIRKGFYQYYERVRYGNDRVTYNAWHTSVCEGTVVYVGHYEIIYHLLDIN